MEIYVFEVGVVKRLELQGGRIMPRIPLADNKSVISFLFKMLQNK